MPPYTHSLEAHASYATLYLRGTLRGADIAAARATCERISDSVRVLRLDIHGVRDADAAAREGIASIIRDWRRDRLGEVIIAAGVEELEMLTAVEHQTASTASDASSSAPALRALYL